MAKLTVLGLYNYDPTLFDGLVFPAGIDKDTAINEILRRSGEFETIYPDFDFLKNMITFWGKKHYRTFEKWVYALSLEFEPLHNYDRHEEYEDIHVRNDQSKQNRNVAGFKTENDNVNRDSTGSTAASNDTTTTPNTTTTRNVSAYDSASYQPKEQETLTGSTNAKSNDLTNNTARSNEQTNRTANDINNENVTGSSNGTENIRHKAHLFGNIGTTKSTEMLLDYLDAERWNIYEHISDIFIDEFCIMVY